MKGKVSTEDGEHGGSDGDVRVKFFLAQPVLGESWITYDLDRASSEELLDDMVKNYKIVTFVDVNGVGVSINMAHILRVEEIDLPIRASNVSK